MNDEAGTVFVVDDDPSVRRGVARLLRSAGLAVETFKSADEFLETQTDGGPACLVLDVQMPGLSGPELQRRITTEGAEIPIVFVTGHGDVPTSVDAMKEGAVDFLTKPYEAERLLAAVARALERDHGRRRERAARQDLEGRLGRLTRREREVFALVVTGLLNKQVADRLNTSEKTIKVHRARVMEKMEAGSLAELVRLAERLDISPEP